MTKVHFAVALWNCGKDMLLYCNNQLWWCIYNRFLVAVNEAVLDYLVHVALMYGCYCCLHNLQVQASAQGVPLVISPEWYSLILSNLQLSMHALSSPYD